MKTPVIVLCLLVSTLGCRKGPCPPDTELRGGPQAGQQSCEYQDSNGVSVKHGPFVEWDADGHKRTSGYLDLPHKRKNGARAAVYRKYGIDPGLCAAFNQNAILTSGVAELLNGFAGARPGVAQDVDGTSRRVLGEKGFDFQFIERRQHRARHMHSGIFRGRAHVQQINGIAGTQNG